MSALKSTTNLVDQNNEQSLESIQVFREEIKPETENYSSIGLSKLLLTVQNGVNRVLKKNKENIEVLIYLALHGLLIGYFAWASYYFTKFSEDSLEDTTCSGYGLLIILFVLFYSITTYYLVVKPYIVPIFASRFSGSRTLSRFLAKRWVKIFGRSAILIIILIYLLIDTADNRFRLMPLTGLFIFLLLGWLFCKHPDHIKWRPIVWGLALQFLFGILTIRWNVGRSVFECIGNKTTTFLNYASGGATFVYGELLVQQEAVFAFRALSTIYFLGFIINILYHYGIMQKIVVIIGEFLEGVMGTTICESVNSAANIFLSMNEAPMLLKPYLEDLTASEIHSIMASGFATVSGTVLAAYISFGASASHLITASVMSAPAALCYSKLLVPETEETKANKDAVLMLKSEYSSALDAASTGASLALEMVLGIIANLIAFISTIYFINGILSWMGMLVGYDGDIMWSIETAVGYVFMPVSFVMGVPWDECDLVGKLVGIKTIVNEFAAFKEMGHMVLRPRTKVIATYALCGFSNLGSIGIMISLLSVLMPKKRSTITSLVFRAFIAGEIVCFMTACVAALLIPENLLL